MITDVCFCLVLLTVDMSDGVSSIGSIIDDGEFDLELKFVSLVMILFLCYFSLRFLI